MGGPDKTLDLLTFLASRPRGATFSSMKEQGYTAPTLSRLLKTLGQQDMVEKSGERTYRLGEGARILARAILGESSPEERIRTILKNLAARTGESAAFYEKTVGGIRLTAKEEMAESFHYISEGGENYQENHAFSLVLDGAFPPGEFIHEEWETAAGFDRLALRIREPREGSLGITFARGRYGREKIEELKRIIRECLPEPDPVPD